MNTIISASVVLFTLYFLVDFIRFIPNACLAAIVIVNLFSLFKHVASFLPPHAQLRDLRPLWRASRGDFATFLVCVLSVVTLGTQLGLLAGILASCLALLAAALALRRHPAALHAPQPVLGAEGLAVVRCAKWLHFLNRHEASRRVETALIHDPKARCVLDLREVRFIDCSAMITVQVGFAALS